MPAKHLEEASSLFADLSADVLSGNVFAIAARADIPFALYVGDQMFVFHDRGQILRGLRRYFQVLRALDLSDIDVSVTLATWHHDGGRSYDVTSRYLRSDGSLIGIGETRYFVIGAGDAQKLSMMEVLRFPTPDGRLPFDPGSFT